MKFIYFLREIIQKLIFKIFFRNKDIFYKKFYGSLNLYSLIFFNILFPGRSYIRFKNKRFLFPKNFSKIDNNIYIETKNKSKNEIIAESHAKLKKYGSIILNDLFDEKILKEFEDEHKDEFKEISTNPSNFTSRSKNLPLTKSLREIWFDETIITILKKYIQKIPTARNYPDITSVTPLHNYDTTIKTDYAGVWHVDHATLIQAAVFFTNVTKEDTHMETIVGSHSYPNITSNGPISNEYVNSKNLTIGHCVGKRGSVQIHCGNVYHRVNPKKNSTRTWVKFHFCSGTNILFDKKKMDRLVSKNFKISELKDYQKKIISGLVPKNANSLNYDYNGYEFKNDILVKSGDPYYYKDSPGSFLWKK